jgi:hypothetical protein
MVVRIASGDARAQRRRTRALANDPILGALSLSQPAAEWIDP